MSITLNKNNKKSLFWDKILKDKVIQEYLSKFKKDSEKIEALGEVIHRSLIVTEMENFSRFLDEAENKFMNYFPTVFKLYDKDKESRQKAKKQLDNTTHGGFAFKDKIYHHLMTRTRGLDGLIHGEQLKDGSIKVEFLEEGSFTVVTSSFDKSLKFKNVAEKIEGAKGKQKCKYGIFVYDTRKPIKKFNEQGIFFSSELGFIVKVDEEKDHFSYLRIALELVKDLNNSPDLINYNDSVMQKFCSKCVEKLDLLSELDKSVVGFKNETEILEQRIETIQRAFSKLQNSAAKYINDGGNNKITAQEFIDELNQ